MQRIDPRDTLHGASKGSTYMGVEDGWMKRSAVKTTYTVHSGGFRRPDSAGEGERDQDTTEDGKLTTPGVRGNR